MDIVSVLSASQVKALAARHSAVELDVQAVVDREGLAAADGKDAGAAAAVILDHDRVAAYCPTDRA